MKTLNVFAALATLLSTSVAVPLFLRDDANFPDPKIDPFYKVPANVAGYQPGQIIRRRDIPSEINSTFSLNFSNAYQVLVRTTDGQGRATATVSTIWVPQKPLWPPKIFSYQVPEDSATLDCAPSWGWVLNSASQDYIVTKLVEGPIVVGWGLNQGYYVVNTDVEGPDAAWLVGKMEGQAGLDGVRAVINSACPAKSKATVALFGYSGGAHTSVWMSTLAASYAPELNLVGAAFGGTPVDLRASFEVLNGGPESALAGGGLFGLANGYAGPGSSPDFNATVNNLLTDKGKQVAAMFRSDNFCIPNKEATTPPLDYNTIFTGGNIFDNPDTNTVLAKESLLSNVSSIQPVPVPKFPRFQYHGTADVTVSYPAEVAYVQQQCSNGANIQFWQFPGVDHGDGYLVGFIGALQFVSESFNYTTAKVACGSPGPAPLPSLNSTVASQVLGPTLFAYLLATIDVGT